MSTALDLVLDESILDDETACEFHHRDDPCTVHVTHVIRGCTEEALICAAAAAIKRRHIDSGRFHCASCKRPAGDCWKILPV